MVGILQQFKVRLPFKQPIGVINNQPRLAYSLMPSSLQMAALATKRTGAGFVGEFSALLFK
jgi:hypothetical protein